MTEILKKTMNTITFLEMIAGGLSFAALTVFMSMDVGYREFTNEGLAWAQKASIILMIWGGVLGASLTSAKGGHLRPEIADKLWPEAFKPFLKVLEHLFVTAFCLFMFYLALKHVANSKEMGDIHPVISGLKLWVINLIFPISFVSMAFRHFIFAIVPSLRPDDAGEIGKALDEFEREEVGY